MYSHSACILTDILLRKENEDLLEAVIRHHEMREYLSTSKKTKNATFKFTSRQGVEKHLMATLAQEYFPVSGEGVKYLLQNEILFSRLQDLQNDGDKPNMEDRKAKGLCII